MQFHPVTVDYSDYIYVSYYKTNFRTAMYGKLMPVTYTLHDIILCFSNKYACVTNYIVIASSCYSWCASFSKG